MRVRLTFDLSYQELTKTRLTRFSTRSKRSILVLDLILNHHNARLRALKDYSVRKNDLMAAYLLQAPDFPPVMVPAVDSQFDPIQLIGSQIPFTDPFADDFDYDFCTTGFARCRSAPAASQLTLATSLGRAATTLASSQQIQHAPAAFVQLLECMSLRRTPSFPPAGPAAYPEPQSEAVPDRARLTPEQAIDIFRMGRTKTARTAGILATKYGISPKAIRDIWTRKSWAQDTRPHWND